MPSKSKLVTLEEVPNLDVRKGAELGVQLGLQCCLRALMPMLADVRADANRLKNVTGQGPELLLLDAHLAGLEAAVEALFEPDLRPAGALPRGRSGRFPADNEPVKRP